MNDIIPLTFAQEFLANQPEYRKLGPYPTSKFDHDRVLFEFVAGFNRNTDYGDLRLEVPDHMPVEKMASNPLSMAFLEFLIQVEQPRTIVELGTFIGISAIRMSRAMGGGSILTVEAGKDFARIATRNIKNNPGNAQVTVVWSDALTKVTEWNRLWNPRGRIGLAFLDADKGRYDLYLEPLTNLLRPGGMLVVDDALFHGDVLNDEPKTEKGAGVKRLLDKVSQSVALASWPKVLLPLGNGILLLRKPQAAP